MWFMSPPRRITWKPPTGASTPRASTLVTAPLRRHACSSCPMTTSSPGLTAKSLRDLFETALQVSVRSPDQQEAIEFAGIVLDRLA